MPAATTPAPRLAYVHQQMTVEEFYKRVQARLPDTIDADGRTITHELFHALAARLKPDEAAELGAELPDELGDLLARGARPRRA